MMIAEIAVIAVIVIYGCMTRTRPSASLARNVRIYELTPNLPRPLLLSRRRFALPAATKKRKPGFPKQKQTKTRKRALKPTNGGLRTTREIAMIMKETKAWEKLA